MKAQVSQEDLKKSVTTASRFSSSRPQIPVLSNILLSATGSNLHVIATNLEISIDFKIPAKVDEEGEITVPAKSLAEIISNLNSGLVSLKAEKEKLILESEGFSSNLLGINASEFPKIPKDLADDKINIPFEKINNSLSKVVFASSYDESRPILTGVLLSLENKQLSLVATDGYRLSLFNLGGEYEASFERLIVPRFIFNEIPRVESDEIIFSYDPKNNLQFLKLKMQ